MKRDERPVILSYGGGTQSAAICVLVAQGRLPRPERIVMADTGREASETWDYLRTAVAPLLAPLGVAVEQVPHELATVDLHGKNGDLLMPLHTTSGQLPTLCSNEWKQRPVRRYLRAEGYGPENPCEVWIGFSTDEARRARPSGLNWLRHWWPLLLDVPRTRAECRSIVEAAGLPTPPKSSCWCCPHRGNAQWARLRDEYPEDWGRAVALDESERAYDRARGGSGVYLHRSRVPLAEADLTPPKRDVAADLLGCDSGFCWT